jgi:hypothetical protein
LHWSLGPDDPILDPGGRPWVAGLGLARFLADPGSPAAGDLPETA